MFGSRSSSLSSTTIFASSATTSPAGVVTSGLISASEPPLLHECRVQLLHDLRGGARLLHVVVEKKAELHRFVRAQPVARINGMSQDLLGSLRRHFLDVDAAGRAHHEDRTLRRTVDDHADIRFCRDVGRGRDENFLHRKVLDRERKNLLRHFACLLGRLRELHPAGFPSPARVHLRFDDNRAAELSGDALRPPQASSPPRRAESEFPLREIFPLPDTRGCSLERSILWHLRRRLYGFGGFERIESYRRNACAHNDNFSSG